MKFSIRDLLLVTVIVALAVGWWVDRSRLAVKKRDFDFYQTRFFEQQRELLLLAKTDERFMVPEDIRKARARRSKIIVDYGRPDSSAPAPKLPKE